MNGDDRYRKIFTWTDWFIKFKRLMNWNDKYEMKFILYSAVL